MIKLGSLVRDNITSFEGIAIARSEWLYGCNRIVVESRTLKDGKPIPHQWFDEQRIETVEEGTVECGVCSESTIELGQLVRDTVTGFEGKAIARTIWSSGNYTVTVESMELDKDGKPIGSEGFDLHRLEIVDVEAVVPVSAESEAISGGPQDDPCQAY